MEEIKIRDDFIKLGQALKLAGLVESGVDAKMIIQGGHVKVNGRVETQRGKSLLIMMRSAMRTALLSSGQSAEIVLHRLMPVAGSRRLNRYGLFME